MRIGILSPPAVSSRTKSTERTNIFSGIGAAASVLSLYWLCRAMESAPSLSRVVTFYCLHLAAEFGVVLLALFVPVYSPLGALVPQLFCVPVLAVCFFLEK